MSAEDFLRKNEENILNYGWTAIGVFPTKEDLTPPFLYTLGLMDHGWPELIIIGIPIPIAHHLVSDTIRIMIKNDQPFKPGDINDIVTFPTRFEEVNEAAIEEYMCQALYRAQALKKNMTALQMVFPDHQGVFYDEEGYDVEGMRPAIILNGFKETRS